MHCQPVHCCCTLVQSTPPSVSPAAPGCFRDEGDCCRQSSCYPRVRLHMTFSWLSDLATTCCTHMCDYCLCTLYACLLPLPPPGERRFTLIISSEGCSIGRSFGAEEFYRAWWRMRMEGRDVACTYSQDRVDAAGRTRLPV